MAMKGKRAGNAVVLTERDQKLIAVVADFGLMSRDQIWRHLRFGSLTRVNATLLRLVKAGHLSRRFQPTLTGWRRALYYVGPAGLIVLAGRAAITPADRRRLSQWSDLFVEHQLLVNDVRLQFADCRHPAYHFERWLTETALRDHGLDVIPDGYVEYAVGDRTFAAFLELDRGTEALRRWSQKTEGYIGLAFSGRYEAIFRRRFFRVLVVAPSARRLDHLRREIVRQTEQIFWLTTISEILSDGPLGSIWRRPRQDRLHGLTEP